MNERETIWEIRKQYRPTIKLIQILRMRYLKFRKKFRTMTDLTPKNVKIYG